MRKFLIINTFILTTFTVLLITVVSIIESHRSTIDRIAPSTVELREKAERMGSLRLTEKEAKEICQQLNCEIIRLDNLKWIFTSIIILILAFTIWGIIKFNLNVKRFDGLSLLVVALLLLGFHSIVYEFSGGSYGGHNASIDIRIVILLGNFIVSPVLFYTSYRMNKIELSYNLHKHKWISYTALSLTVLGLFLAFIVGIGALFTPDLSGNIS